MMVFADETPPPIKIRAKRKIPKSKTPKLNSIHSSNPRPLLCAMPLAHKAVGRHESLSASQSPPRSEHPQYPDLADDNDSEEQPGPSPSTSSPPIMRAAREVNTQQPPVITGTTANSKTTAVTLTSKRASPIPSSPTLHTVLTDASPTSANNHEAPASMPPAK
ncbi:12582_t:CDS:1, partial [Acaulospora colombiana]